MINFRETRLAAVASMFTNRPRNRSLKISESNLTISALSTFVIVCRFVKLCVNSCFIKQFVLELVIVRSWDKLNVIIMPQSLCKQSKKVIASLINYFERERAIGGPLLPLTTVREVYSVF